MAEGSVLRRRPPRILLVACVCGLIAGTQPAAPVQAATREVLSYLAVAEPPQISVCVGESEEVHVTIMRRVQRPTENFQWQVTGGRVLGFGGDTDLGHFDPAESGRDIAAPPEADAVYKFVGDSPGQTELEFVIKDTGEEATLGGGWPTDEAVVQVEVTDCFEAYTSSLASIFTTKDMGGLNHPFLLSGYTPNTHGITTDTQVMFFIPSPRDNNHGSYAFVDKASVMIGPGGSCITYFSGRYDVVFYLGTSSHPVEGDLVMMGHGVAVCGGYALPINYPSSEGFRIGFKPKAHGP